jgi:hypothetical protein
MLVQVANTDVNTFGNVIAAGVSLQFGIPPVIPFVPGVPAFVAGQDCSPLVSGGRMNKFAILRFARERVAGCVEFPLPHDAVTVAVLRNVETVESLAQSIKCGRGCVDLEIKPAANGKARETQQNSDLYEVLTHREDFSVSLLSEPQNGTVVEFNFDLPVGAGVDPVPGLKSEVNRCG